MLRVDTIRSGASLYGRPRVAAGDLSLDAVLSRFQAVLTAVGMAASTVALWLTVQALPAYVKRDSSDFSHV